MGFEQGVRSLGRNNQPCLLRADQKPVDRLSGRPGVQHQNRSVVFTDIVGSTGIIDGMGDSVWLDVVTRHHRRARRLAAVSGADALQSTGDGVLVILDTCESAVAFALAMVEGADHGAGRSGPPSPRLRAGVACGPVMRWAGDYFGRTLHLAARLTKVAEPGQVLKRGGGCASLGRGDARFEDEGVRELRGFDEPQAVHSVKPAPWPPWLRRAS